MMVTLDRAGRVVIPKEIRDRLSLDADTELEVSVDGDAVVLSPKRTPGRRIVAVNGWPVIEAVRGLPISDTDVQRWRDDVQR